MTGKNQQEKGLNIKIEAIKSITSVDHRLATEDHEIDLKAIASTNISLGDIAESLTDYQKQFILKRLNFDNIINLSELPASAIFMIEKISNLTIPESIDIIKEALIEHEDDVNFPTEDYKFMEKLVAYADEHNISSTSSPNDSKEKWNEKVENVNVETNSDDDNSSQPKGGDIEDKFDFFNIHDFGLQVRLEAAFLAYHSPYPEVRAVTDPYDDPSIPCETFRVYLVAIIWTCIGTFINQFFSERQPSISLSSAVVQLFLYPSGKICEKILPNYTVKIGKWKFELNPGPWNHKEQMLATIFYSVSNGVSYVSYNIHAQLIPFWYNNTWVDFGYQTLLILSTNFLGISFAGIIRRFAVFPTRSIWPTILPTIALNKALLQKEVKENISGWKLSRYRWFFYVFGFSFIYNWIPTYLFNALSYFNWTTWISPMNTTLVSITGSATGLGLNPLPTFDWNIINFNGCLIFPFYAQINQYIGTCLGFLVIVALWFSNYKWTGYIPINSSSLFNHFGTRYSVQEIVDDNSLFDQTKYDEIGPPYYSAANLVVYGAFIALYPFSIVYEGYMNRKPIWNALKGLVKNFRNFKGSVYDGFNDPHTIMMKKYKEVPDWVFFIVLVISTVLAILCVKLYPAQTPVWGIFFAIGINFVFLIPLTAIYAATGFSFGLNVLVQLIVGFALPGNGLALMLIKAFGYNINGQAQNYISDQKMGFYVKVPPRAMFRCQMLSVFISSFVGLGVLNFQIKNIPNYCSPTNTQKFTCPNSTVFYNASILWGVIGPRKVFGGLYPVLQWCFLIGFLLAFPCIAFKVYAPKKYTKYFQPTLVIGGFLYFAPYNLSFYTMGVYFSIFFMWYLKSRYSAWWQKYNYLLSSGMDSGVAFSAIIIFFAVQYKEYALNWWGNTVTWNGIEGLGGVGRLNATLAQDGYFGLRPSQYP
ncbi:uncharacterized protein KGF55_005790 [Candida pseudojiufengensis]|uniref:uncharacterized protein n=1 Tax=Candida pseudojiufengensis TaxID=497109 RepID=UPI002224BB42|nr:uncharacterized protein KGF55_005790 [Candida pseudojiufengensis]KAI5958447.1 hypothetical protein KGF55_005790 [Candida pseudojiufengensis]